MRKPMMAGNWKMNKTNAEATELASQLVQAVGTVDNVDIVLCPPFTALGVVAAALEGSNLALGAQDVFWTESGAYTGEVSAQMLASAGVKYVIVGHSERRCRFGKWPEDWPAELRSVFGDNDVTVNWKARAVLDAGLTPIICCGETIDERRAGSTDLVVRDQVTAALQGMGEEEVRSVVFAYEPVWAIGTGEVCDAEEANRVLGLIRSLLGEKIGEAAADSQILYGGSVKPDNVEGLMQQPEIDGGLVGGASLKAESFVPLVEAAGTLRGS
ncbi:MAG: triosephosphate isomerase [Armatimonadetes bacterium]|nr:triosephosphate isomerase [Armatimonadota bacterium]